MINLKVARTRAKPQEQEPGHHRKPCSLKKPDLDHPPAILFSVSSAAHARRCARHLVGPAHLHHCIPSRRAVTTSIGNRALSIAATFPPVDRTLRVPQSGRRKTEADRWPLAPYRENLRRELWLATLLSAAHTRPQGPEYSVLLRPRVTVPCLDLSRGCLIRWRSLSERMTQRCERKHMLNVREGHLPAKRKRAQALHHRRKDGCTFESVIVSVCHSPPRQQNAASKVSTYPVFIGVLLQQLGSRPT